MATSDELALDSKSVYAYAESGKGKPPLKQDVCAAAGLQLGPGHCAARLTSHLYALICTTLCKHVRWARHVCAGGLGPQPPLAQPPRPTPRVAQSRLI